jgi:predicted metalloprotease
MLNAMRYRVAVVLAVASCLGVAACGSTDQGLSVGRSNSAGDIDLPDPGGTTPPPSSVPDNPDDAAIDFGSNKTPQPYDEFLQASLADVQDYWRETYPTLYDEPWVELSGGIYASYPDRTEPIPQECPNDPEEAYPAENNAFYCGLGDYMAYDDFSLIPTLTELYGDSAVGVVFAHEFGHAVQARAQRIPDDAAVVFFEQQADCFAGSWTAHVARGESDALQFADDDIKSGMLAMVAVKDPQLGTDVFSGGNHGTAFDRVGAFEHGFIGGAEACKGLETEPLPLLNLQFSSQEEFDTNGNLPYEKIGTDVTDDLTRFWTETFTASDLTFTPPTVASFPHDGPFPDCEGIDDSEYPYHAVFCPATNEIFVDDEFARTLYSRYGDYSVGYVISNAWSDAVQTQLGSDLTGEPRVLINNCLTGAWTSDTIPPADGTREDQLYISPGDLDEAVETALILSDEGLSDSSMGSAFEHIENFRAGVLGGISECITRSGG